MFNPIKNCNCLCESKTELNPYKKSTVDNNLSEIISDRISTKNSILSKVETYAPKVNELDNEEINLCQKNFQFACLEAHNKYRSLHGAPPLVTNLRLQEKAIKYAKFLAETDSFEHSGTIIFGENLGYVSSSIIKDLGNCSGKLLTCFF